MTSIPLTRGARAAVLSVDAKGADAGLALLVLAGACWSAWVDVARRADAAETAVAIALVVLAACAPAALRLARGEALLRVPLAIPCLLLTAYLACFPLSSPALVRAWIALAALLYVAHCAGAAKRPGLAFFGLALLALPVLPSFEFHFAYPMRVVSAAITTFMLKANGLAVSMEGVALRFRGDLIQFDAPCSGVRMLWTSGFLASAIAHVRGFNASLYAASLIAATILAIFGNAVRAASLFPIESGLLRISAPFDVHEAVGLAAFAITALALVVVMTLGPPASSRPDRQNRQEAGVSGGKALAVEAALRPTNRAKLVAFSLLLSAAALAPLAPRKSETTPAQAGFPGWPTTFEGRTLVSVPLAPEDSYFARGGFPGRISRFTDGDRHVVVRWVNAPTRRLHPAAQCFKGAGYAIEPRPVRRTADDALMECFAARKEGRSLQVCEMVRSDDGRTWPDVSSWHWSAMLAPPGAHWWSYVIVERE